MLDLGSVQGLTYLLIIFPAIKAPTALPIGAGVMCNAAIEFEAFSVRAKYVAILEIICSVDQLRLFLVQDDLPRIGR